MTSKRYSNSNSSSSCAEARACVVILLLQSGRETGRSDLLTAGEVEGYQMAPGGGRLAVPTIFHLTRFDPESGAAS